MSKFYTCNSIAVESVLSTGATDDVVLEGLLDTIKQAGKDFWEKIKELIDMLLKKISEWNKERKENKQAKQHTADIKKKRKQHERMGFPFYFSNGDYSPLRRMMDECTEELVAYANMASKGNVTKLDDKKKDVEDAISEFQDKMTDRYKNPEMEYAQGSECAATIAAMRELPGDIIALCKQTLETIRKQLLSVENTFTPSGRIKNNISDEQNSFIQTNIATFIALVNDVITKARFDQNSLDQWIFLARELEYIK